MAKPARRSKAGGETGPQGRNLVERLLVECVLPERRVPAESGVRFHVTRPDDERSVCLIFHVDVQPTPLIDEGPRPDFLVLHATRDEVILTIVEMKGKSSDELKKGVDQIEAFAERLRRELKEHLPGRFRPHLQGILLMAHGAHPPLKKIADADLTIAALSYHHSAELHPYVRRRLTPGDRYQHRAPSRRDALSDLELLLIHGKEEERRRDGFHDARVSPGGPGIYVNYAQVGGAKPRRSEYCALAADRGGSAIGVQTSAVGLRTLLVRSLEEELGLSASRRELKIVEIE